MDSFSELKKNRKSDFAKLNEEITRITQRVYDKQDDDRFWRPELDKAGVGNAIIRFLPAPQGEDLPYVRYFEHSFQGPTGNYFIELCPTTIGKECPVCKHNNMLWNSGVEANKALVSQQKRKLRFISNILILKDTAKSDAEGQVKLYRYGKKVFDKINELMHPSFEDEEAINPFDMWEGANFKLRIRTVDRYPNYEKSEFDKVAPISEDDKYLEELWKKEHSLKAFVDKKHFKSEETLDAKLKRILGTGEPKIVSRTAEPKVSKEITETAPWDDDSSELPEISDDDLNEDYFKNLVEND
jgi:hypothetical protein